jgi:RND family efflux transporter MFP subunit
MGSLVVIGACGPSAETTPESPTPPAVAVETAEVSRLDVEQSVEIVGSLAARKAADVKPEHGGVVTEVFVTDWVKVTRGTALARLDVREPRAVAESARSSFLQAQVAAERAARELERTAELKDAGLATQQALDEARTVEQAARAGATAARAQQQLAEAQLDKATLRAPIDGLVYARNLNVGDYVDSQGSEPAFKVADTRDLELVASVPAARSEDLSVGQQVRFRANSGNGAEYGGKVSSINPEVDQGSRTTKIKVLVSNEQLALKPGLFVRGKIVTGLREKVIVAPRSALASWDPSRGTGGVFVVEAGMAHWRTVQTGAVSGDVVEITAGLNQGDRVVTRGAFNLHDGDRIASGQEG